MSSIGGQAGGLTTFVPFALILAIFYFLILMPMQRRQKKVAEFQQALKVGDKIVTTGGIYGQITRVNEKSMQLQIADKVRIEIARALMLPEVKERLSSQGLDLTPDTPEQFSAFLKSELVKWAKVIKELGMRLD